MSEQLKFAMVNVDKVRKLARDIMDMTLKHQVTADMNLAEISTALMWVSYWCCQEFELKGYK